MKRVRLTYSSQNPKRIKHSDDNGVWDVYAEEWRDTRCLACYRPMNFRYTRNQWNKHWSWLQRWRSPELCMRCEEAELVLQCEHTAQFNGDQCWFN